MSPTEPNQNPETDGVAPEPRDAFRETMEALRDARRAFLNRGERKAEMLALAKEAADLYNERAKATAARNGMKARPITADRIMRSADMFR